MIEGHTRSEFYVDDLKFPSVSIAWDKGYNYYLGGNPSSINYLKKAAEFLRDNFRFADIQGAKVHFSFYSSEQYGEYEFSRTRN